jgi:hypothetical protein
MRGVRWATAADLGYGWRTVRPPTRSPGPIFPGLHIQIVTVQAESNKRGTCTQQVTFGYVHCVQCCQQYCSVSGCCYKNTCATAWQYEVYTALTRSRKLPIVQQFWHVWSVSASRFEICELPVITSSEVHFLLCPKLDHTFQELSKLYWDARRPME